MQNEVSLGGCPKIKATLLVIIDYDLPEVEDQEVQTCQGRILTSFSALEVRPLSPEVDKEK